MLLVIKIYFSCCFIDCLGFGVKEVVDSETAKLPKQQQDRKGKSDFTTA